MPFEIQRHHSRDKLTAEITFPTATLRVTAEELGALIAQLGELRSAMLPEVPREFDPAKPVQAIDDPAWAAAPEKLDGDILVYIRDRRFAWLHYRLPRPSAEQLGTHLLILTREASTPATRPN